MNKDLKKFAYAVAVALAAGMAADYIRKKVL